MKGSVREPGKILPAEVTARLFPEFDTCTTRTLRLDGLEDAFGDLEVRDAAVAKPCIVGGSDQDLAAFAMNLRTCAGNRIS